MKRWLRTAMSRDVAFRAWRVSILVGTILIAINYTDRLIGSQCTQIDYLKMGLTYLDNVKLLKTFASDLIPLPFKDYLSYV